MIGFRFKLGRELLRWTEPSQFATRMREQNPVHFPWWKRLLGFAVVMLLSYANWYFRIRNTPSGKEMTLGVCLGLGGFIGYWLFIQIPWMFGSTTRIWLDTFGLHWWRGPRWGGIRYSRMADYSWKTWNGVCVLSVRPRDTSALIEVGVPNAEVREKVTVLLDSFQVSRSL